MNCAGLCWLYRLLRGRVALTTAGCSRQTRCVQNFPSRPAKGGPALGRVRVERCDLQWLPGDVWRPPGDVWRLPGGARRLPGGARPDGGADADCSAARPGRTGAVPVGRQGRNLNCAGILAFIASVQRRGVAVLAAAKCGRQPEITAFSNFPSRPVRAGQHSVECALERCDLQWRFDGVQRPVVPPRLAAAERRCAA